MAVALALQAAHGPVQAYLVGNWQAPFGIALVLDRLAALMLVLTRWSRSPACSMRAGATPSAARTSTRCCSSS